MKYEEIMGVVFSYKERRQFSRGIKLLHLLEEKYVKDPIVFGLLGTFYYERKDYKESEKYFKKTTILNPSSELASLGLFHSLIHLGKINSAIRELIKFTSSHEFDLYKTTIIELRNNKRKFGKAESKLIDDTANRILR